eukprot:3864089-Rhodomonas_salina.2
MPDPPQSLHSRRSRCPLMVPLLSTAHRLGLYRTPPSTVPDIAEEGTKDSTAHHLGQYAAQPRTLEQYRTRAWDSSGHRLSQCLGQ